MYQVLFDNLPLYDPRDEELSLHFQDPDVHLAVGEAGEMSFTLSPEHPYASRITRTKGVVELRSDDLPIFKGRIRKDTRGFYKSREIEVEGLLACLNDSIIPPFDFPTDFQNDAGYTLAAESGNVVEFFLAWLLEQHNAQVGPAQQIQLGTVTVRDPNNYISRSSSGYLTTMEAVRKKLEDLMGGYLLPDYSGEVTKLHYYEDLPLTNVQEVEFGKNLLDLISELDDAETCTAILPIGADGLTIESLPDGEVQTGVWKQGRILYSKEAEDALGGRITRMEEWKDVTLATNLRTKAIDRLVGEGVKTLQTITVKAADLGAVEDLPRFAVGRYVRLRSAPHGFADVYPLMELDPDILDPGNTEITMGSTVKASTDITHAAQSATQERQDQLQLDLNQQRQQAAELASSVQEQATQIVQTCEGIILTALESYVETSNYDEYRRTVESQFEQMANRITLTFKEASDSITNVNGELQRTVETLSKHFEFALDGLTIKAGENAMSLKLDNGLISFWMNGRQFGTWDGVDFHTGNIIIDVNERAQFGNFAAIPRSKGNLSWLKVRG
jgi:hypothetical protein